MPAGQSVVSGSFTQLQSALGAPEHCRLPLQVFTVDDVAQPSLLVVQLSTVAPLQTVPLDTPAHSGATAPHRQSALPGLPPHGLPAVHVLLVDEVGQPSAFTPQMMTVLPLQTVPLVSPAHSGATGPQRQSATPLTTAQGLPAVQVFTGEEVTQPCAVVLQATTALAEQTVPLPMPAQATGAELHWQEAAPAPPRQVSLGPQVVIAVIAGQPSVFEPQVIIMLPLVQTLPTAPMQEAGAAPQEHEATGNRPVHGLPAGQVLPPPWEMQLSTSVKQLSSVVMLEQ
jgi:hypothetical protein